MISNPAFEANMGGDAIAIYWVVVEEVCLTPSFFDLKG